MRFDFKQFSVDDAGCAMKVGTDSVLLGSWCEAGGAARVLDLGAGSGLLALMMAQRCPQALVTAVEIDQAACAAAAANFAASPWADHLHAVAADALGYADAPFDLVICNPPYFASSLLPPDAGRVRARHDTGGFGPVSALSVAARLLAPEGSMAMVTPAEYDDAVTYGAEMLRLKVWRKCRVTMRAGRPASRILWQLTPDCIRRLQLSDMAVRGADNAYTDEYRLLTNDFYLHLK